MTYREQLAHELAAYDIQLTDQQLALLLRHLELVIDKNKVLNLTRIDTPESGITRHVVDSLLLLPAFQQTRGAFLDLGTGAGFPGVPLAIASDRSGVLCDSVKKKVVALDEFIQELGLSELLSTSSERAETLAASHKGQFGCVVARAVASLPVLLEYATPLLRRHGRVILTKGKLSDEERAQGAAAARLCGLRLVDVCELELPRDEGHREIVVYEKVAPAKLKLPRAVGKAKKEPLGAPRGA